MAAHQRSPAARVVPDKAAAKGKWEGEDEDDDGPSDWEASSEDDEKEAARRAQLAAGGSDADYNEDAVFDPREKARLEKERELESDLHNATELFGSSADADLDNILKSSPNSKEDIVALSEAIIAHIVKRHQDKPLYSTFVEHHVRAQAMPPRDIDVRKAASGLTTLANEKYSAAKPILGASKVGNKLDTTVYDEALNDFWSNTDDFM
ncbi:translation initiation factor eIF3 subunit [Lactarius hengduanensis]|nr:translation initiation factor eIF3 subunit [Lactarius hengduanensis]